MFNKVVNNLNAKAFFDDNPTLPCDCTDSLFVDKDQNHFITANLKIVDNNKLTKRFFKGPKYRQNSIGRVSVLSFFEWRGSVISVIDEKISHFSTNVTTEKLKNTLKLKH